MSCAGCNQNLPYLMDIEEIYRDKEKERKFITSVCPFCKYVFREKRELINGRLVKVENEKSEI